MASINGVQVTDGASVKWGLLASVVLGGPVYAAITGYVDLVQMGWTALRVVVTGPLSFLADVLDVLVGTAVLWVRASWLSFLAAVRPLGPFAFPVTVLAVIVSLRILWWGVGQIDV